MKRQILQLTFFALFVLSIAACNNNKPAETPTIDNSTIGSTGIPIIDKLTQQIAQNPTDPNLLTARAKAFYENKNYDSAIEDMGFALKADSTNADYHHFLSDIYLDYYKSRLAWRTMKRCVNLHPKRIPSLLKLAEVEQILEMYDASMATITRVMAIEPNNPDGFFMIGLNHTLMGNKPMAIKNLKRCVELDPDYSDAWDLLGS